ncbi:MAG: carbon-nitrogen hydrolase family protein [Fimbriimonadaceae bacterium]|nr:carbon-nitrogen hydrolase family protein [Fimbriimonadaceae bacterium]
MTRIGCAQLEVAEGDTSANLDRAVSAVREAAQAGVQILVLPECFLTGYVVRSEAEARGLALSVERGLKGSFESLGTHLAALENEAGRAGIVTIVGFAGHDRDGLYNAAAVLEPGRAPRCYTKTHLPWLGFDRFAKPGRDLPVFETSQGRIGVAICFDLRIPEVCRTLALRGAELIALPTNWPNGADRTPLHYVPTRASENRVFLATCNRCGEHGGVEFIGQSAIHGPDGEQLARIEREEGLIWADLDLPAARSKTRVVIPGEYETDTFATRQPGIYEP